MQASIKGKKKTVLGEERREIKGACSDKGQVECDFWTPQVIVSAGITNLSLFTIWHKTHVLGHLDSSQWCGLGPWDRGTISHIHDFSVTSFVKRKSLMEWSPLCTVWRTCALPGYPAPQICDATRSVRQRWGSSRAAWRDVTRSVRWGRGETVAVQPGVMPPMLWGKGETVSGQPGNTQKGPVDKGEQHASARDLHPSP